MTQPQSHNSTVFAGTGVVGWGCRGNPAACPDIDEGRKEKLDIILKRFRNDPGSLIPVLQEAQKSFGWLGTDTLHYVAERLRVPWAEVYGVASFYAQFYLEPRGENMIRVCTGTACHVRGAEAILNALAQTLGISPGGTTEDKEFSLERVACLGACGLAPVVMINEEAHGRMAPEQAVGLIGEKAGDDGVPAQNRPIPSVGTLA